MHCETRSKNLKGRNHLGTVGVNVKTLLKSVIQNDISVDFDSSVLGYSPMDGSREHDDEPSLSLKAGEFLDQLNDY